MPKSAASSKSRSATRIFTLTARADRIERLARRHATPSSTTRPAGRRPKAGATGLAPQLTLEGAILRAGGFKDIAGGSLGELAYVALRGGEPAGETEADRVQGRHAGRASRQGARASCKGWSRASPIETSPIARWSARCGRRATATTTIWRASRNGRPAARTRKAGMSAPHPRRRARRQREASDPARVGLGRRPMPARARPMCWRSA